MKTMTLTQLAAALTLAGLSGLAIAANSITQIELLKNAQEQQVLAVTFSNPLPVSPNSFAISNPPRVAFDFPDTRNQTGKTQLPFATSLLNAATVVEGQGKARLVLSLNKSTAYTSKRLCCTNQQQDELPQSPDGLIPCGPFAACPVL